MRSEIRLLETVSIETPCHADWDGMTPVDGDRVRHCDACRLNVHNLSAMSRKEGEALLTAYEGQRLCVQYAQKPDGSIQTDEVPRALRPVRNVLVQRWAWAASLAAAVTGLLFPGMAARADDKSAGGGKAPDEQARQVKLGEAVANAPVGLGQQPAALGRITVAPAAQVKPKQPLPQRLGRIVRPAHAVDTGQPEVLRGEVAAAPVLPVSKAQDKLNKLKTIRKATNPAKKR